MISTAQVLPTPEAVPSRAAMKRPHDERASVQHSGAIQPPLKVTRQAEAAAPAASSTAPPMPPASSSSACPAPVVSSSQLSLVELPRPRPLRNAGQSCFINAPVVATFGVEAIRTALRDLWSTTAPPTREAMWEIMSSTGSDSTRPRESDPDSCSNERRLAVVFRYALQGRPGVGFLPRLLLDRLYHGHQEDAEEFLRCGLLSSPHGAPPAVHNVMLPNLCTLFQESRTRCAACGHESRLGDAEMCTGLQLSLLTADGAECLTTVQAALTNHFASELMPQDFRFTCESCGSQAPPLRTTSVVAYPEVLVLQFKRWRPGHLDAPLRHVVPPADHVDLQGVRYRLCSFVCHVGPSIAHGHYTACMRYPAPGGEWWYYDDTYTVEAAAEKRGTTPNEKLYLALYERVAGDL